MDGGLPAELAVGRGTSLFLQGRCSHRNRRVRALRILAEVKGVSFSFFTASDVVRHPMVQHIVEAYERESRKTDED